MTGENLKAMSKSAPCKDKSRSFSVTCISANTNASFSFISHLKAIFSIGHNC